MSFSNSKTYLLITLIAYGLCLSQALTSFDIDDFSSPAAQDILTFDRDAYVPEGSKSVRLTKLDASNFPEQNSVGRVLYNEPITFWEPGKQLFFGVTLQFVTRSVGGEPGSGLTFFIVPAGSISPTGGEGDGHGIFGALAPNSSIFATDFDIHINKENDHQIGIVIDSRPSKSSARLQDSIFFTPVTAKIIYIPNGRIIVSAFYGTQTTQLSYVYDLKKSLPQQVQIGVSAATGENVAVFTLLKWSFTGDLVADHSLEETSYIKQYV